MESAALLLSPQPPQRFRLREQFVLHLACEIISRRLVPGDSLPSEPELAKEFGISKVVVRECIQELAAYGMLHVQHGKRTVVLEQSEWDVLATPVQEAYHALGISRDLTRQLYDVRLVLEISAAGWAAEHATEAHISELDRLVDQMRSIAAESRDLAAFLKADRTFHDVIGRAAANMVLRGIMRDLHNYVIARWTTSQITQEQLKTLTDQHAAIAGAVRMRDPAVARAATESHLRWAKDVETERDGTA